MSRVDARGRRRVPATGEAGAPWQLQPVSARTRAWTVLLVGVLPMAVTAVALALASTGDEPKSLVAGSVPLTLAVVLGGVAALSGVLWFAIDRGLRRHRVEVDDQALTVATSFYRRRLGHGELRLDKARVVDLDERPEFRPVLKTNGTGLPGFTSGWFRLRNMDRALVAVAGGRRVVWIPTTRGFDLLLQPRDPRALLERLGEMAPPAPPR